MAATLAAEHFWVNKSRFANAERQYYESLGKDSLTNSESLVVPPTNCTNVSDVPFLPSAEESKVSKGKFKKSRGKKHDVEIEQSLDEYSNALLTKDTVPAPQEQRKSNAKKNKNKNNLNLCNRHLSEVNANIQSQKAAKPKFQNNDLSNTSNLNTPSSQANNKNLNNFRTKGTASNNQCTLVMEIAKAREHIKNSLEKMDGIATLAATPGAIDLIERITSIEKDNQDLRKMVKNIENLCLESQKRIYLLESQLTAAQGPAPPPAQATAQDAEDDGDDGVDLFGSDDEAESAEAARIREERLAAYAAKKSKKPVLIAKSSLVLDVKPWDDETDLKMMEAKIREITSDGLLWGASKFVPVAFGIQKLSISCVVEDEKVSIDWLTEEIEKNSDFVQSVDVAAFNKI